MCVRVRLAVCVCLLKVFLILSYDNQSAPVSMSQRYSTNAH